MLPLESLLKCIKNSELISEMILEMTLEMISEMISENCILEIISEISDSRLFPDIPR